MTDESKTPSNQGSQSETAQSTRRLIIEKRGNLSANPSGIQIPPAAQFTPVTPVQSGPVSSGPAASGDSGGSSGTSGTTSSPKSSAADISE
jgi:hypothetical protein